jgi:hypothetical protein
MIPDSNLSGKSQILTRIEAPETSIDVMPYAMLSVFKLFGAAKAMLSYHSFKPHLPCP